MLPFIAMIRVHDAQLQSSNNIRPSLPRTGVLEARSWLDSLLVSLLGPLTKTSHLRSGEGKRGCTACHRCGWGELDGPSLTSANPGLGLLIAGEARDRGDVEARLV